MTVLIIGTPDSGKSEKAEALTIELSSSSKSIDSATTQKKYYIATMIPYGDEGAKRVEKHRKLREGKGFVTIEKPTAVHELIGEIPDIHDSTCLLECMSNLIGNEMHANAKEQMADNGESTINNNDNTIRIDELHAWADRIITSVMKLAENVSNLIIVTNSFPLEDASYDEDTKKYVNLVHLVNEELSSKVDIVYKRSEDSEDWGVIVISRSKTGEHNLRENN